MIVVNANFVRWVRIEGARRPQREGQNVTGMDFPGVTDFREITPQMVREHPKAMPAADSWVLQSWAKSVKSA